MRTPSKDSRATGFSSRAGVAHWMDIKAQRQPGVYLVDIAAGAMLKVQNIVQG
jgi:hypothetical protein